MAEALSGAAVTSGGTRRAALRARDGGVRVVRLAAAGMQP